MQCVVGARFCGSENVLLTFWFDLGQDEEGCLHGTVMHACVCVQGHARQLSVLATSGGLGCWVYFWKVFAKRQWKAVQPTAEHTSQHSRHSSLMAAPEAVRGDPRQCWTHLCVSASFAHRNLIVLLAVPQTQEVTWASGPPPAHQMADCWREMACPLMRYAAICG